MTINKRLEIDQEAYKLRDALEITTPIDFKNLVEKGLGGKLKNANNIEGILDAKIERTGNHFVIYVNESKDEYRQRFSIAHEISHLILDMGYDTNSKSFNDDNSDMSFNREGGTEEEYAANEFAAALLMPKDEFRFCVDNNTNNNNMVSIEEVSKHFQVSVQAVLTRGKFLGIFKW